MLTVFAMFASCLNDDDEPKDKQKTVTLYVSVTTGEHTGMTGTPHESIHQQMDQAMTILL